MLRPQRKHPESIARRLDKLSCQIERMKINEYVDMLVHPKRMLWANFVGGLTRGFGTAVGFTLLGALFIYLLQSAGKLNLPVLGRYIAELVKIVQENLK